MSTWVVTYEARDPKADRAPMVPVTTSVDDASNETEARQLAKEHLGKNWIVGEFRRAVEVEHPEERISTVRVRLSHRMSLPG